MDFVKYSNGIKLGSTNPKGLKSLLAQNGIKTVWCRALGKGINLIVSKLDIDLVVSILNDFDYCTSSGVSVSNNWGQPSVDDFQFGGIFANMTKHE